MVLFIVHNSCIGANNRSTWFERYSIGELISVIVWLLAPPGGKKWNFKVKTLKCLAQPLGGSNPRNSTSGSLSKDRGIFGIQ